MRANDTYTLVGLGWWTLVFGGTIAVLTGTTEPHVTATQFPGEQLGFMGGAFAALLLGTAVLGVHKRRAWSKAGAAAGLSPTGGGLPLVGDRPSFTGQIRGRPVEVRIFQYTTGSGDQQSTHTYTVVETELDRPLHEGVLIRLDTPDQESMEVNVMPSDHETVPDEPAFEVLGPNSAAFGAALLAGRPRDALAAQRYLGTFRVGDASTAMANAIPDAIQSIAGAVGKDVTESLETAGAEHAAVVSHTTEGVLLDGDELRRQAEAVVAVAEAVDGMDRPEAQSN